MLINTVILFIRDALPIFVLLAFLLAQIRLSKPLLITSIFVGLMLAILFIQLVDELGSMFDGTGLELSLFSLHLCLYLLVLALGYNMLSASANQLYAANIALAAIMTIIITKGSNFLLYFNGHLNQLDALQSMSIGMFLGLGICLSLTVLLYFFMVWLKGRFGIVAPWIVLLVFVSGQLMNALNLLIQVDILPAASPIWNSQWLLDDESEYGHLLNVLFGYVESPSILQISLYTLFIFGPLIPYFRAWFFTHSNRGIIR